MLSKFIMGWAKLQGAGWSFVGCGWSFARCGVIELERIQKRAVKTILGPEYTSYEEGLSVCNIDSLATRRTTQCFKFAESLSDNIRCKHLIPPTRFVSHGRNLRNSNSITQLRARTTRFQNSPVPYFINLLNSKKHWFFFLLWYYGFYVSFYVDGVIIYSNCYIFCMLYVWMHVV